MPLSSLSSSARSATDPPDLGSLGPHRPALLQRYFSRIVPAPAIPWNLTTMGALVALVLLWALRFYSTWAAWGNLTIDSGHEMYVPQVLSEGKMLYRDVWFMYGPAAPYFNCFLFRLFGVQLNVLYWAGSLAALGSAIFLYLAGMRLSSWIAGWAAGAVVLIQAFQPSLFCFPLPYSFSAVYGCLTGCIFIWILIAASSSTNSGWTLAAGFAAAIALLLKLEFGAACYLTLLIWIVARGFQGRSLKLILRDLILVLPGVLLCLAVIHWMTSIAGMDFILQENFMSWPASYFMKAYGKYWLASTGFNLTFSSFLEATRTTFLFLAVAQGLHAALFWRNSRWKHCLLRLSLSATALAYLAIMLPWHDLLLMVFFPKNMILYVTVLTPAAWLYFHTQPASSGTLAFALLPTFSVLLAFRILLDNSPSGYPIYYNGPVILSFFFLVRPLVSRPEPSPGSFSFPELALCILMVSAVLLHVEAISEYSRNYVPLVTARGTVLTSPRLARNYRTALAFIEEKQARGESVLSVPEDTSLYFLSGEYCPTRVFQFTPGTTSPGKMTEELIDEIERKQVRYLIWSNRTFFEYGVPRFGLDFDQTLGAYFRSHYQRVGFLRPDDIDMLEWTASIWQRKSEGQPR